MKKKRRMEGEPEVTFELPVSLDALDERVAEGAMRGVTKRGRGRGGKADGSPRKRVERGPPDRACEGCGRIGLKVWRQGPGGKRTLCNSCGDKHLRGTLGDLKALNAISPGAGASGKSQQERGDATDAGPEQAVPISLPETRDVALQPNPREHAKLTSTLKAVQPIIESFDEEVIVSQPIGASIAAGRIPTVKETSKEVILEVDLYQR
ncbi:MAG: hypothetical protein TREMPRED_000482 [Tremellales sp. Tagirdzhanova-0007]|nr:MAG: hypothetical protein TREMPRED_000482 [Tremellales sp. Tagirdzhanova-0007]